MNLFLIVTVVKVLNSPNVSKESWTSEKVQAQLIQLLVYLMFTQSSIHTLSGRASSRYQSHTTQTFKCEEVMGLRNPIKPIGINGKII